jgi:RNA polymerase sigma-70 factor (ECF subfamily)
MLGVDESDLQQALQRGYVAAYRWLGSGDEARDACQEAMARALSSAATYDRNQPFYPWFYRILKNHCLDRHKRLAKSKAVVSELRHTTAYVAPSPEAGVVDEQRCRAVSAAVSALPPELREVIELRHFQDLSYEEIAQIVGCPVGTVMSRLYRARKELRSRVMAKGASR